MDKKRQLFLPDLLRKIQNNFEQVTYPLLNLMSIANAVLTMKHSGVYGVIVALISLIVITAIVIGSIFLPFPVQGFRHRRALFLFVCIIAYGTAIGGFILSL